jgi:outer membrane protein assembly factor BamB
MQNPQSTPPLVVVSVVDHLVAINLYTGQHVWECPMEMATSGRLVVDQGVVLYAPQTTLYCLDYLTGALRWKVPTGLSYGEPNMFLYAGCLLLAASGELACFNIQTGAQLWHEKSTSKGALLGGNAMAAPGLAVQIDRRS